MSADPFITIWEFTVSPENAPAFLAAYGPAGKWAALFRRAPGYRGTELYRDRDDPTRYLTVDFWLSPDAFRTFRDTFQGEYKALDQECEHLTRSERPLGTFGLADPGQTAI
jgi:heme-degrading monooxygenase HmoA